MKYLHKLSLNLCIIGLEITLIWVAYKAFTQQWIPIYGAISVIITLAALVISLSFVRRRGFKYQRPSLFKTSSAVILIAIICTFAGVQPMATYKDNTVSKWNIYWAEQEVKREETRAATQVNPKLNQSFAQLFNEYRQSHSLAPLVFTNDLNRIAELRLIELQSNFNHSSKGNYNDKLAENIVRGVSTNQSAIEVWKSSPGHKMNMLNKVYKNTGYAIDGGYAIQMFSSWDTVNGVPQLPPGWYFPK